MEPVRIFIGSDIYNVKAERALIFSIKHHASVPTECNIMSRFDQDDTWTDWQCTDQWATCFSCFRWGIPAACGFEGRAIYLDSDQIVLTDIAELANIDLKGKAIGTTPKRESSVSVFDCAKFKDWDQFQLDHLKEHAAKTGSYYKWLRDNGEVEFISQQWNCLDGDGYDPLDTKLIHYTKLTTQPWHPAPHRFNYKPHERPDLVEIWRRYYELSYDHPEVLEKP
jgi:hypothetical protein